MANIYKTDNIETPRRAQHGGSHNGVNTLHGVFVATVTDIKDSIYTGRVKVRLAEEGTNQKDGATHWALLCTPYGGVTDYANAVTDDPQSFDGSVKSYGMWPQPPAVGSEVVVAFTPVMKEGLLIGTTIKRDRNHMMGGNASGLDFNNEVMPVGEKNPYDTENPNQRPQDTEFNNVLTEQGLTEDYSRGHSMSSARRETPSNVFGITTLNGHTFTMDDGSEQGDSRNIRMRSRGGAQILIDDTNKFVYVTNHKGNAWIEMDEDGRIDIYGKESFSVHTEKDFNVHAGGQINMESAQGVNIRSMGSNGVKIDAATADVDIYASKNFQIQADANGNVKVAGSYKETAGRIDMNGPVAKSASRVIANNLVENTNVLSSASARVPEHHPWKGASKIQETFTPDKGGTS